MANPPKGGDAKPRVYPLSRSEQGTIASCRTCHLSGAPLWRPPILEALQQMRNIRLLLAPVVASVLIGSTLAPATVGASSLPAVPITLDSSLKIHPLLQYEMQSNPTTVVRVIIQQVRPPGSGFLGGLLSGGSTKQ